MLREASSTSVADTPVNDEQSVRLVVECSVAGVDCPHAAPARRQPQIIYILKMFPRFSETFILNEILGLEALGFHVRIYSLKKPNDGRFHAELARLKARVRYVPEYVLPAALDYLDAL